jgi:hypothetical protein
MDFTGRVYFSFSAADVFRFYRLLDDAITEGVSVGVEWVGIAVEEVPPGPLAGDHLAAAIAEELRHNGSAYHAAFIETLLASVHVEGVDLAHPRLIPLVLDRVGADTSALLAPDNAGSLRVRLEVSTAAAKELGVKGVPSVFRHGPVLLVRTSGAVANGKAGSRLALISSMMEDDGLWELSKP